MQRNSNMATTKGHHEGSYRVSLADKSSVGSQTAAVASLAQLHHHPPLGWAGLSGTRELDWDHEAGLGWSGLEWNGTTSPTTIPMAQVPTPLPKLFPVHVQ